MTTPTQRLLSDIQDLAPEITSRIPEIEAGRRIPIDLVEALRSIGIFRLLVSRSYDGLELELPEALKIITALSRIDGSVGWTVGIASGSSIFASMLQPEIYRQVYGNGPDAIVAGSAQPSGTAEATAGGWRVSGCESRPARSLQVATGAVVELRSTHRMTATLRLVTAMLGLGVPDGQTRYLHQSRLLYPAPLLPPRATATSSSDRKPASRPSRSF
jgi:hypothetical protein